MMKKRDLPYGMTEQEIRAIIDHYDSQSDKEAAAEFEAHWSDPNYITMSVPKALFEKVSLLIQDFEDTRRVAAKPANKTRRSA